MKKNIFHNANPAVKLVQTADQKLMCCCVQISDSLDLCDRLLTNAPKLF